MFDTLISLLSSARGAWRFRWSAVAAMWLVGIVGWVAVVLLPNTYETRARIYVDSETVLKPLLSGLAVGTDVTQQAAIMSRIILAKPNLERVARETDLYLQTTTPEQQERIVAGLGRRIKIASSPYDANLFQISFEDRDRVLSQRIVNTVLTAFVEDTLGLKRADSRQAQQFIEEQLRDYERKLHEAEDRLADFKRKNAGLMPGETGDYYSRLQTAQQAQASAEADLRNATNKRDELMRQLQGEEPTVGLAPGSTDVAVGSGLDAQISQLQARLNALLVTYTEKYPEVISLRETIARLRAQREKEEAQQHAAGALRSDAGVNALNINPVYQSMRIALSQTELQLVESRNKVSAAGAEVARLRGLVNTAPEVEAELKRLTRDYEVNHAEYQQLLQRLESARLGEEASVGKSDTRFRVVEPPTAPLLPTNPNRPLLDFVVLLAALGAGVGFAILRHQTSPVFSTRTELAKVTGLPVLGSVAFAPSPALARHLRRQPLLVGACVLLLMVVCAITVLVTNGSPMVGGQG